MNKSRMLHLCAFVAVASGVIYWIGAENYLGLGITATLFIVSVLSEAVVQARRVIVQAVQSSCDKLSTEIEGLRTEVANLKDASQK